MNPEPPWAPGRYKSYDGINWEKQPDPPPRKSRFKRLVKFMTEPGRLVWGVPTAWVVAWLCNSHVVTNDIFFEFYGLWLIGSFLAFWLYELHAWAGGKSKLGE